MQQERKTLPWLLVGKRGRLCLEKLVSMLDFMEHSVFTLSNQPDIKPAVLSWWNFALALKALE